MGKPAHNSKPGKGKGGGDKKEKKVVKQGKKALKERKQEFLKKQLKKSIAKDELAKRQIRAQEDENTISIAWKGKKKDVDKKELMKDSKGRAIMKKIKDKRVLSADEKHKLKMMGSVGDLMRLWETLREKNKPKKEKNEVIAQIMELTKESFLLDARKPDMSRIFQSVLKWADHDVKTEIYERCKGHIVTLSGCSHANQFVKSLIEHGSAEVKENVHKELCKAGHKLIAQKYALIPLEHLYNKSNGEKQNLLLCSFFDGIEVKTYEGYPKIGDILSHLQPSSLDYKRMVERLHSMLTPVVAKASFDTTVVHRLMEWLFKYGTEFEINDIIEDVGKAVVNISRTKPGAATAALIASHSSQRGRKSMLKSFKHSVAEMCCSKATTYFVARFLDLFDEAEVLIKSFGNEMVQCLDDLVVDPVGSTPLLHLLTPDPARKQKYFTFNHFDDLWNADKDPFHMAYLTPSYKAQEKKICEVHPKTKHMALLKHLLPRLTQLLLTDIDKMAENVIARRIMTELVHYAKANKGLGMQKTAVAALEAALEKRSQEKEAKRKHDAVDGKDAAPAAKKAKPAAKKAAAVAEAPAKKVAAKKKVLKKKA
eukprot:TRINITY_DN20801_c0_g1_i1.p1 TRINITY_DN20801_c0_g1~~TRINITY_DN20801_c0_g1_i1.p1  ORF type:complete len:596 (+),score=322.84 TRINITY_DN20801_c0_g1_i1:53-1840(+)